MANDYAIGVDVGGTKIAAAVVDGSGRVIARESVETPGRSTKSDVVATAIVDAVESLLATELAKAIGVGAAGFVDAAGQRVMFAPHLSWRDEPLADILSERLGLPVVVDNDANAALWAEAHFGAARGFPNAVLLTLGTGVGGAVFANGRPYRGGNGMAGEFGHMQVVQDGRPCECGRAGCWEQYCSGKALARFAREAGRDLEGPALMAAARDGDIVARGAFQAAAKWLGIGLANVVAMLDPEIVVIGGGVSEADDLLLGPARKVFAENLVAADHRQIPPIVKAELGPDAGVIGAAELTRLR